MQIIPNESLAAQPRWIGLGIRFAVITILVLVLSAVTAAAGYLIGHLDMRSIVWKVGHDLGHGWLRDDIRLRQALLSGPHNILAHAFSAPNLPLLTIDIKFKHMQKLHRKRKKSLAEGVLTQEPDDFVPASIRIRDRTVPVKLRLKGDFVDHLGERKWSLRVHTKRGDQILGMRRFSIQHPKVRGFQGEVLINETARRVGLIAPRYRFVNAIVNGDSMGVMALEEHFSKELLESSGRREGVIVRFDESLVFAAKDGSARGFGGLFDSYLNAPVDPFQSEKVARSPTLAAGHALGVGLLRGFTEGELHASQVFDTARLGRYLALAELWGSWHMIRWHNQRFYLNPITARLEPIVFDADLHSRRPPNVLVTPHEPLTARMLADSTVFNSFRQALGQLNAQVLDGSLTTWLATVEAPHLAALWREFPLAAQYPLNELAERAQHLATVSADRFRRPNIGPTTYPTAVHAYLVRDDSQRYLELANPLNRQVTVRRAEWLIDGRDLPVPLAVTEGKLPLILPPTPQGAVPAAVRLRFAPPSTDKPHTLQLTAVIAGSVWEHTATARPYYLARSSHPVQESTVAEQLARHSFLAPGASPNTLVARPGRWDVEGNLVVPTGQTLTVRANTTLRFAPDAALIAHGPLLFSGTMGAPIVLEGRPDEDGISRWQGLVVLAAGAPSYWSNVTVRDTDGVGAGDWLLTGGVTFYESDLICTDCVFTGNRAEDALNVVHARFTLRRVTITNTASDAFDADFAEGVVEESLFTNIGKAGGGDGVDVSGSTVTVTGTVFRDVADKALSIGEASTMIASGITVERSGTGAASKDGSSLTLSGATLSGARVAGLMAYVKKSEYGPGRIEATDITFTDTDTPAVAQTGSEIWLNGESVPNRDLDVDRLYTTVMQKGTDR